MRMGIIAERKRKRRAAQQRKHVMQLAAVLCVLAGLACAPSIGERIGRFSGIQAFSQMAQQEITLEAYDVYALQLAVFDNGERAAAEARRLQQAGVRCVIWQQKRMRIVADAALSREKLNLDAAKGQDAYVISDTLEGITLRLRADAAGVAQAKRLLETPDAVLKAILTQEEALDEIVAQTKMLAGEAAFAQLENALYAQLAQSLLNWCDLMETTLAQANEAEARSYGAVTMCLLCRELRQALSAASTASAQRTPSTAADVMPPA